MGVPGLLGSRASTHPNLQALSPDRGRERQQIADRKHSAHALSTSRATSAPGEDPSGDPSWSPLPSCPMTHVQTVEVAVQALPRWWYQH